MYHARILESDPLWPIAHEQPKAVHVEFASLDPHSYFFDYVVPLLEQGTVMAKTQPMFAVDLSKQLNPFRLGTLDGTGNVETEFPLSVRMEVDVKDTVTITKDGINLNGVDAQIPVAIPDDLIGKKVVFKRKEWQPAIMLVDPKEFRNKEDLALIAQGFGDSVLRAVFLKGLDDPEASDRLRLELLANDIALKIARKTASIEDINSGNHYGPNVWLNPQGKFQSSYVMSSDAGKGQVAIPNPVNGGDIRIVLPVQEAIQWEASWGKFPIAGGVKDIFGRAGEGAIATFVTKELFKEILEAKAAVEAAISKLTDTDEALRRQAINAIVKQHFFKEDGAARFDIYGMKRGFMAANLTPYDVESDEKVNEAMTLLGRPGGAPLVRSFG